ncbi:MAG: hypothetical protein M0P58_05560 [Bacteroidales bacterium]|nr:hypothetical protein [Bacteroidales bacterium]
MSKSTGFFGTFARIHQSCCISSTNTKPGFTSFPGNFRTAVSMEFFERRPYYGVMSVLSAYLVLLKNDEGLGFSSAYVTVFS